MITVSSQLMLSNFIPEKKKQYGGHLETGTIDLWSFGKRELEASACRHNVFYFYAFTWTIFLLVVV